MWTDEGGEEVLGEMKEVDEQWAKIGLYLLDKHPTDVMMFTFMSIDTVQHHFWQYLNQNHCMDDAVRGPKFGDGVVRRYQRLDAIVGKFLERLPEETTVVGVCDHGGGAVSDRVVYLNLFLAQLGLLSYQQQNRSAFGQAKQKLVRSVYKILYGTLGPNTKKFLAGLLPGVRERFEGAYTSFANIDWAGTKAHCSEILASPPSIWINKKGEKPAGVVSEAEYEPLLAEITQKLGELKDPRTGEPIISRGYRRGGIFYLP